MARVWHCRAAQLGAASSGCCPSVLCVVLGAAASSESFVRKMDELNAGVMFLSQLLYSRAPYGLLISDCGACHLPVEQ